MNPLILGPLIDAGRDLIDRIFPDKVKQAEQRANAEREVRQMALAADEKITAALAASDSNQTEINKIEAASDDKFKSWWRPAVGWVCVMGLAYQFIGWPLLSWVSGLLASPIPPKLEITDLITILFGVLGLGAYRMNEKKAGVA